MLLRVVYVGTCKHGFVRLDLLGASARPMVARSTFPPHFCIPRHRVRYLNADDTGLFLYGITTFSTYEDALVSEVTRPLSAVRYEKLIAERADSSRIRVRQRRVAFLWKSQAFELHIDVEPAFGVSVLYRRSEVRNGRIVLCVKLC